MQMYGNFEGFPLNTYIYIEVHEVWVGVILLMQEILYQLYIIISHYYTGF